MDDVNAAADSHLGEGGTSTIDRCGNCHARIALRRPAGSFPASPWRCRGCNAVFIASPQLREGRPFHAGTRPAYFFDVIDEISFCMPRRPAEVSGQDIQRLRACLSKGVHEGPESRRHRRFAVAAPVTVLSLSPDLRIVGEPARAITVDVSVGGVAILHPQEISSDYLAIDFSLTSVNLTPVLLRKLRSKPVGSAFEIAGQYVSRIEY